MLCEHMRELIAIPLLLWIPINLCVEVQTGAVLTQQQNYRVTKSFHVK